MAQHVNFDYPFSNAEFERIGLHKLQLEAIDTVELAQVLLPENCSFRHCDLTTLFANSHEHPHTADSDESSTAKSLLTSKARLLALPTHTTQALILRLDGFIRETGDYLKMIATPPRPLKKEFVLVGPLVLRRPMKTHTDLAAAGAYPDTESAQKHLRLPRVRFRKAQAQMMDAIYSHATKTEIPLYFEAGTGLGKTLGVLLPYAYLATPEQQLVVDTYTLVLTTQLITTAIPALDALLGRTLPTVELKSPQHYLDRLKFAECLLTEGPTRTTTLLTMKLLVWLKTNTTGDLDELHLTTYRAPLFAEIRHTGDVGTPFIHPFYTFDFYRRLQE